MILACSIVIIIQLIAINILVSQNSRLRQTLKMIEKIDILIKRKMGNLGDVEI